MADDSSWVVVLLGSQHFGVPTLLVQEMVVVSDNMLTRPPKAPPYLRGLLSLRGKIITLIDLRLRLGFPSMAEEIQAAVNLAKAREKDHRDWVADLEACIHENRPFKRATDPHLCAFGKWYDNLKTTDRALGEVLVHFDSPHRQIHASALEVIALMNQHKTEEALQVVARVRNGPFLEMMELFKNFESAMLGTAKEIAVVIEAHNQLIGVTVDSVDSVEHLIPEELPKLGSTALTEFVSNVGRVKDKDNLVMILDPNTLAPEKLLKEIAESEIQE